MAPAFKRKYKTISIKIPSPSPPKTAPKSVLVLASKSKA